MKHVVFLIERQIATLWVDRRVLNQARTFVACGWRVTVLCIGPGREEIAFELEDGITALAHAFLTHPPERQFIQDLTGIPNDRIGRSTNLAPGFEARLSAVVDDWPAPGLDHLLPLEFFNISEDEYRALSFPQSIFSMYRYTDYFYDSGARLAPDLIWCADCHPARAAWRLHRDFGIPYIIDFHELTWGDNHRELRERKIVHRVEGLAARNALAVSSVSELIAELTGLDYGLEVRPFHLGNVPAFPRVAHEVGRQRLAHLFGVGAEDRVVLFHGSFNRVQRNIELLLQAQAACAPARVHLVFVGRGDCDDLIAGSGPRVHRHPMVDQSTLAEFVAGADFVLIPYRAQIPNNRFSAANKFHDALFLRTPLILSDDLDDAAVTVSEFGIGWVMPMGSLDDLVRMLERVATEPLDRRALDDGFSQAERALGAPTSFARLKDLIRAVERVIATPGAAAREGLGDGPLMPRRYLKILERRRAAAAAAGNGALAARIDDFMANRLAQLCGLRRDAA